MKYVQSQFSLKYEPKMRIRRNANEIEDFLQEYYGPSQTTPIPDDFAAEAPRIILNSKNGHSQITFSQISVDFATNFDGDFSEDFKATKDYMLKRIELLRKLLIQIECKQFYFFGITYNVHLDTLGEAPMEYIKNLLGGSICTETNLYEASQRVALIEEDKYFINKQIGTYKEYQGKGSGVLDLLDFKNSKIVGEGINVAIDINNRYSYLQSGQSTSMSEFDADLSKIIDKIQTNLRRWE